MAYLPTCGGYDDLGLRDGGPGGKLKLSQTVTRSAGLFPCARALGRVLGFSEAGVQDLSRGECWSVGSFPSFPLQGNTHSRPRMPGLDRLAYFSRPWLPCDPPEQENDVSTVPSAFPGSRAAPLMHVLRMRQPSRCPG